MVRTRRGTFKRCKTAVAATASGGETMAPSTRATDQGKPGNRPRAVMATAPVVITTRPMARVEIGRRLARKSRHEVKIAAW